MKRNLAPVLIAALLLCTSMRGQDMVPETSPSGFTASLALGFNTFALGDVRNFYDGLLEIYRANGVPIPTQREFPGNLLVGASIMYAIPSALDVGLGSRYTWTRAFSSYEDYAGTANVNGKVSMVTLEGIIERNLTPADEVVFSVGARGGLVFGRSEYTQSIIFNGNSSQKMEILLTASGTGFTAEGCIGAKRRLGDVMLGMSAGYRYANLKDMNADLSLNGQSGGSGTLSIEHNLSGFILAAHIDVSL